MRIVTWNVNSLNARLDRVLEWIDLMEPDVLCLQETKLADDAFPADAFTKVGYESTHHGEGRWNGVAILSRVGLDDPAPGFDDGGDPDPDARIVWATCAGVRIASAYIPNGREVDHDHYKYKLEWLGRLHDHLDKNHKPADDVVVVGDYNIAPEDRDVWDTKAFEGATHVTKPERDALAKVQKWGLTDVFREQYPETDGLFTYYDYTAGRFHKRQGIRIDLVLATKKLAKKCSWSLVDRNARKATKAGKPSDHCPLIAEFAV